MLLGGDELGRTQRGNNNAYCQDNEISWFDWNLDDRRRALLEFTRRLIALRRRAPDPAAAPVLRGRLHLGVAVEGSGLAAARRQRDDAAGLAEAVDLVAGVRAGRRRDPDDRRARPAAGRRRPAGADERAPRADRVQAARRGGGRRAGCWSSTPRDPSRAAGTRRARTTTRSRRGRWWCCGSRSTPKAARAAAGAPGAGRQAAGAAAAAARRASLVPLFSIRSATGWGHRRHPGHRRASRPGRGGPGFSVLQLLPVNAASRRRSRARTRRSSAFALDPVYLSLDACEDFVGRRRARRAARRDAGSASTAAAAAPLVDWPRGARRSSGAGIALAFERFLRDEWRQADRRARSSSSAFMRGNRDLAGRLRAVHRAARRVRRRAGSTGRARAARARAGRASPRVRREHADELLRAQWLQWQLDLQWRQARREASAAGRRADGRSAVHRSGSIRRTCGRTARLFRLDQRLGTPPDEGVARRARTGACRSTTGARWQRDDFSWIRRARQRAPASSSASTASTTRSASTAPTSRSTDGKTERLLAARRAGRRSSSARRLMRIMSRFGEVVAEDLGAVPAVPAPVAGAARRPRLPRAALGAGRRRATAIPRRGRRSRSRPTPPTTPTPPPTGTTGCRPSRARAAARSFPALAGSIRRAPFDDRVRDLPAARALRGAVDAGAGHASRTRWADASASTSPAPSTPPTGATGCRRPSTSWPTR